MPGEFIPSNILDLDMVAFDGIDGISTRSCTIEYEKVAVNEKVEVCRYYCLNHRKGEKGRHPWK